MNLRKKRLWFTTMTSGLLMVIFSVVTVQSFNYFSLDTIREQGRMAAEMLRISLTEQMRTGVISERGMLFARLRTIPGLDDVRVIRGPLVVKQFGPGIDGEQAKTAMEKRVQATGKWEEEFIKADGKAIYRITIPYIASSTGPLNCLQCHNVPEGNVNGVVTLGFSLENMLHAQWLAILPLIIVLLFFGLCLGYFLKRLFQPMVETAESVKAIVASAGRGDFSGRVVATTTDEIGEIAHHTNTLLETLDQSIGKISSRIKSLGGHARGSESQHDLLEHTIHIVDEMVGATRFKQAVENDLDLDEIFERFKSILKEHFMLSHFSYYQVEDDRKQLKAIFVEGLDLGSDLWCDPEILVSSEVCRAKRTAACVSSIGAPRVCNRFCGQSKEMGDLVHICIPMMLSGRVGGILQLVMTADEAERLDDIEQTARLYLNQAAPVIEARQLMQSLKNTAMRDPMTGFYNRRFIEDYIDNLTSGIIRQKSSLGLLMCDVDFFKKVNDTYGHDVGDQVIVGLAELIKRVIRSSDLAIRFGGEEFLILLLNTDAEGCMKLAEKIRLTMEEYAIQTPQGPLKKTISIGISLFPEDGEGFWECLKYSDTALYKAKEGGRNQCLRFTREMWSNEDQY